MGLYRNDSLGVVNVGGVFIAPKKVGDIDEKTPGADRMIKRGVLVKSTASKPDPVPTKKDGGKTE